MDFFSRKDRKGPSKGHTRPRKSTHYSTHEGDPENPRRYDGHRGRDDRFQTPRQKSPIDRDLTASPADIKSDDDLRKQHDSRRPEDSRHSPWNSQGPGRPHTGESTAPSYRDKGPQHSGRNRESEQDQSSRGQRKHRSGDEGTQGPDIHRSRSYERRRRHSESQPGASYFKAELDSDPHPDEPRQRPVGRLPPERSSTNYTPPNKSSNGQSDYSAFRTSNVPNVRQQQDPLSRDDPKIKRKTTYDYSGTGTDQPFHSVHYKGKTDSGYKTPRPQTTNQHPGAATSKDRQGYPRHTSANHETEDRGRKDWMDGHRGHEQSPQEYRTRPSSTATLSNDDELRLAERLHHVHLKGAERLKGSLPGTESLSAFPSLMPGDDVEYLMGLGGNIEKYQPIFVPTSDSSRNTLTELAFSTKFLEGTYTRDDTITVQEPSYRLTTNVTSHAIDKETDKTVQLVCNRYIMWADDGNYSGKERHLVTVTKDGEGREPKWETNNFSGHLDMPTSNTSL